MRFMERMGMVLTQAKQGANSFLNYLDISDSFLRYNHQICLKYNLDFIGRFKSKAKISEVNCMV